MTDQAASRLAWMTFGVISLLLAAILISPLVTGSMSAGEVVAADLFALIMFSFPLVGILIASRRPRNAIPWILLAIGLAWQVSGLTDIYIQYGLSTTPPSLPRPDVVIALGSWLWVPGVGLIGTFLILLFPNGHLPSPRWKPLAWISATTLVLVSVLITVAPGKLTEAGYPHIDNPLGLESLRPLSPIVYAFIVLIPLCIIGCAVGLIRRFRRARGLERLQLKWLSAAAAASAALYLVAMVVSIPYDWTLSAPLWIRLIQNIALFSFVLIPIAVGIAMLRHRLYDIDLLINRTLVYGGVTGLLSLVYAIGSLGLGGALRSVTGQQSSSLAVAGSTLAVAALFRPVRSWVQAFIDRRFYRRKYDATRTLAEFSARLRDEIDLDSLNSELVGAVSQALQPAHVSLWIRPPRND